MGIACIAWYLIRWFNIYGSKIIAGPNGGRVSTTDGNKRDATLLARHQIQIQVGEFSESELPDSGQAAGTITAQPCKQKKREQKKKEKKWTSRKGE